VLRAGFVVKPAISVQGVTKTYASGFQALQRVDLEIRQGEIFALLGPNGAGKTTLISIICGIVTPSSGTVLANGHDIAAAYRAARSEIGLVPQELATDAFETVLATVSFSRGLFGKAANPAVIEKLLRDLSLWDKRHSKIITLSGGMKRRVMIAKALSHEPRILFLDEPTAGVDVELRRDMWDMVRRLRESGVTIFLTTHYIEEAEQMADRIGIINGGRILMVEDKTELMNKLGTSQLTVTLREPLTVIPAALAGFGLGTTEGGTALTYSYDAKADDNGIAALMRQLDASGIAVKTLHTHQSSLEEIFVGLVHAPAAAAHS
jgi:ABC-2 type transport system ATP-binding protein